MDNVEYLDELSVDPRKEYPFLAPKIFREMIKRGVLSVPMTPEQEAGMKMLQWVCEDKSKLFLRFMISKIRKRDREMLIMFPTLSSHERGIVTMFLNCDDSSAISSSKAFSATVKNVQKRIKETCGYDISADRVRQLRQMAYDYKRPRSSSEKRRLLSNAE